MNAIAIWNAHFIFITAPLLLLLCNEKPYASHCKAKILITCKTVESFVPSLNAGISSDANTGTVDVANTATVIIIAPTFANLFFIYFSPHVLFSKSYLLECTYTITFNSYLFI